MPLTCSCGDWVDAEEWHFGAEGDYYKKMPNLLMAAIYGPNWREDAETEPQDLFLCV